MKYSNEISVALYLFYYKIQCTNQIEINFHVLPFTAPSSFCTIFHSALTFPSISHIQYTNRRSNKVYYNICKYVYRCRHHYFKAKLFTCWTLEYWTIQYSLFATVRNSPNRVHIWIQIDMLQRWHFQFRAPHFHVTCF